MGSCAFIQKSAACKGWICGVCRALGAEEDGFVSYGKFRNFLVLLPEAKLTEVDPSIAWFEAATMVPFGEHPLLAGETVTGHGFTNKSNQVVHVSEVVEESRKSKTLCQTLGRPLRESALMQFYLGGAADADKRVDLH